MLLVFFHEVTQDFVLFELAVLLLLSLEVVDLNLDLADLLTSLFFLFAGVLDIFVALAHLLFKLCNLVNLIVGHSQGSPIVGGLHKNLTDQLFTLFD